jgi:hypothetical protein
LFNKADVRYDELEDFVGESGNRLKKFAFHIEMVPSGASTEFAMYYKGERLASHSVSIEFE